MLRFCTYNSLFRFSFRHCRFSTQACIVFTPDSAQYTPELSLCSSLLDPTIFPLSSADRSLLQKSERRNQISNGSTIKLEKLIMIKDIERSIALFSSILYRGNVFNISIYTIMKFLALLSDSDVKKDFTMYRQAIKWLLNIGYMKGGRSLPGFYWFSSHIVRKYLPDHIPSFMSQYIHSSNLSRLDRFNFLRTLSIFLRVFSASEPHLILKHFFFDRKISWRLRLCIVEALLSAKYIETAFDLALSNEEWPDLKVQFISLCQLLIRVDAHAYDNAINELGAILCSISSHKDKKESLIETYNLLVKDIHIFKAPLGFTLDVFTSLLSDDVLPPWSIYTILLNKLADDSHGAINIIYTSLLKRCEGPPPSYFLFQTKYNPNLASVKPFTSYIQTASLNRDLRTVEKVYRDIIKLQIPCDQVLYVVLLNHLRNQEEYQSISELYFHLRRTGYPLTPLLYACFLDGLGRSNLFNSMASRVYQDADGCGALRSAECLSVVAATLVRTRSYFEVVNMWSSSEEEIISAYLITPYFLSLLLKSAARAAKSPSYIIEIWRKVKCSCPKFCFTGENFMVALSHLVRLHYRPFGKPDPQFKWPLNMSPISPPEAYSHFKVILSDLPKSMCCSVRIFSANHLVQLRWFADTFPLIKKLLTDLHVKL